MYVGNLMLLALNLPLVGLFVSVLRIPYAYLYPLIVMFCIIGVYEVSHAIVDVWIMLIMGAVGYFLRKLDFDPAPLVLGLVIAPTFELSLRQSLIMSNGNWAIFLSGQRPIAAALFAISGVLLALAALSLVSRRDWREGIAEGYDVEQQVPIPSTFDAPPAQAFSSLAQHTYAARSALPENLPTGAGNRVPSPGPCDPTRS